MAVLAQYTFTGSVFTPTTTASGVTNATIQNESLAVMEILSLAYGTSPVMLCNPAPSSASASAAIANDSYFYFSITPESGKRFSLTSLTFSFARGDSNATAGYDVRSSVDEYAVTLGTANGATQRPTFSTITIDLSGAEFQNVSTAITFRIYVYATNEEFTNDFDDITINGSVSDGGTVEQEGFRWRADDGNETAATWLAAQDTNIIKQIGQNARLRVVLNSTLDRGSEQYRLEYRQVGTTTWLVIEP